MEELDDILYDDVEAKYLALQNKKRNRKKRRRRRNLMLLVIILVIGGIYFNSDYSKVKSLAVRGNTFYSEQEVLQKAQLSYNTRYILIPKMYIRWKLEQDPLIENVKVHKDMFGAITIDVKERGIVGYLVSNNKNYLLLVNGRKVEIQSQDLGAIVNFPLIHGFRSAQLKKLAHSFAQQKEAVHPDIIHMMSEITPYATSYDKHMVKIVMQDGNTIFTSYESMPLLNMYLDTIKGLNKDHACLWPDISTRSIQSLDCSSKE